MSVILPVQYLNPVVLRCSRFDGYVHSKDEKYTPRVVYDYEFEYYIRGEGGIVTDGVYTAYRAGDMNIRKPGQIVEGIPPYECYILCVDMVGNAKRSGDYAFGTPDEAQEQYESPLLHGLPDKITVRNQGLVLSLLQKIQLSHSSQGDLEYLNTRSALLFLLSEIFQQINDAKIRGGTSKIKKAVAAMEERFSEPLCIGDIVAESGYQKAFFHQRFREETGTTPGKFIARLRMEKAKDLLAITKIPVSSVGLLCGYEEHNYFSRVFRRYTGMTPYAFRAINSPETLTDC